MTLKSRFMAYLPSLFRKSSPIDLERTRLYSLKSIPCNAGSLHLAEKMDLAKILHSTEARTAWNDIQKKLVRYDIVDGTGGVNPGDRRAIFFLIYHLQPESVLEVGTHIGASTIHIASALSSISRNSEMKRKLVSVDINDVNSTDTKPWLKYGTSHSPAEMMREMNFDSFVEFVTQDSHDFITNYSDTFDFIFLDGNHAASTVYKEVPAALKLLNPGGIILLHDYFPGLKPLWSNGSLIPGPFLAIERLHNEGAKLHILPIGRLPWPTKLGSSLTSLALLLQDH